MKKLNKVLAVVIAVMMVLSLSVIAFAANNSTQDANNGSITVDNYDSTKNYVAYKIFDVTYADGAAADGYAYTIAGNSPWYAAVSAYATAAHGMTLSPVANTNPTTYVVTTTSSFSAPDFAEYLKDYKDNNTVNDNGTTLSNGAASGLALGYWFVTTTSGALCNLTTTHPSQTIYDKNAPLDFKKDVDDADGVVEVGQVLTYTIESELPPSLTGYDHYYYRVSDTMSNGLTFNNDVVVKFGNTTIFTRGAASGNQGTYVNPVNNDANSFTWEIDLTTVNTAYLDQSVTITYTATVNANAIVNSADTNSAILEYSNDPNDSTSFHTTPPEEVKVYTLNVDISKKDSADQTIALAGASFILYEERTENNATVKYYYQQDSNTKAVSWTTNKANAKVFTTPASGQVSFEGLDLNGATGNYFIEETAAPLGYNLPTAAFPVVITKNVAQNGDVTFTATVSAQNATVDGTDQSVQATILNEKGQLLPETGGIGTTVFYVLGIAMIFAAAVLVINKRRMAVEA
ncbi:MAG: SpaH/EbpB family LPXTG-anchored major pilin, partial [Clostridia bacterium]|nr:SpaH/EbpB family LPXTG-anchored major pilin [Clostridia bacterium]